MGDFDGQVAWVTGGVSGIGGATARSLAGGGARVGVLDIDIGKGASMIGELGLAAEQCDVADEAGPHPGPEAVGATRRRAAPPRRGA
ncbi:MAG: SDR family NAD(P)-dependent oxidoreductase, partial [Gammaproteobacteria bacterium]|nr:SDR family NAD(P)-dependent oxidoreductase [Gammaproteobacteria bacterium]